MHAKREGDLVQVGVHAVPRGRDAVGKVVEQELREHRFGPHSVRDEHRVPAFNAKSDSV